MASPNSRRQAVDGKDIRDGYGSIDSGGGGRSDVRPGHREGGMDRDRDGGRRQGDREEHRHEGRGWGAAHFVFGGVAAGLSGAAGPQYYDQPDNGDPFYQLRPTYDQWNDYVGRRWVDVCQ